MLDAEPVATNVGRAEAQATASQLAELSERHWPGRWSRLPTAAIFDDGISAEAVRVLGVLCLRVDKNGEAFPRIEDLAGDLGCSDRQVQRHLRALEARGFVAIQPRVRPRAGGQTMNLYRVQYVKLRGTGTWVKLPISAVLDLRIPAEALRLLAAVASYGGNNRVAFPSTATLAVHLRVQPRQIRRLLKLLVAAGHLRILRRSNNRGRRLSNIYELTFASIPFPVLRSRLPRCGHSHLPSASASTSASPGVGAVGDNGVMLDATHRMTSEGPSAVKYNGSYAMSPDDSLISPLEIEKNKQRSAKQQPVSAGSVSPDTGSKQSELPSGSRLEMSGNALRGSVGGVGGVKPRTPRQRVDIAGFKVAWTEILTDAKLHEVERGPDATDRTWEGFIQDLQRMPGKLRSAIKNEVLVAVGRRLKAAARPQRQACDAGPPPSVDPAEFRQEWTEALIRSHQFNPDLAWRMWGNFEDALTRTQVPYRIRREVIDAVSVVIGHKAVRDACGP